jgi:hypothetical protein
MRKRAIFNGGWPSLLGKVGLRQSASGDPFHLADRPAGLGCAALQLVQPGIAP